MMIHQIWLGGNMPAQEQEWTAGVRAGAEAAGHEYRLWTDRELEERWGQYAHWRFFARLRELEPGARVLTLMSDYYRLLLLHEFGGVYLDADMVLEGPWPRLDIPPRTILAVGEFWARCNPCTGFMAARKGDMGAVMTAANEQLAQAIVSAKTEGLAAWWARRGGRGILELWGPKWYRGTALRRARAAGIQVQLVPPTKVGHAQWGHGSALTHVGTAHWH